MCVFFLSCYRGFAGALVGNAAAATGILILNLFIFVSVVCYFWCHWLHFVEDCPLDMCSTIFARCLCALSIHVVMSIFYLVAQSKPWDNR